MAVTMLAQLGLQLHSLMTASSSTTSSSAVHLPGMTVGVWRMSMEIEAKRLRLSKETAEDDQNEVSGSLGVKIES